MIVPKPTTRLAQRKMLAMSTVTETLLTAEQYALLPDNGRGADVCFYSFNRLARGPIPAGYLPVPPELVFEVRSPTDRWSEILTRVGEYLKAGVLVVCVLDPQTETLIVYPGDEIQRVLSADDELTLPEVLGPDFRVPVRRFLD
jgi:Uma2 family endonuclease